ncbi:hypothetical protein [Microbacterium sp.]|uniref:hypothetical protein n=1 Tax=Microbacterium sp. TaxID=51671 RepID=UPI003C757463
MTIIAGSEQPRYVVTGTDVLDRESGRLAKFGNAGVAQLGADWLNGPDATPEDYVWSESVAPEKSKAEKARARRKYRALHAPGGSIAADDRVTVEDAPSNRAEVIVNPFRGAKHYKYDASGLPLIVRKTSRGQRVRIWRTPDGKWWREAGAIQVRKWDGEGKSTAGGERAFVLTLFKGANVADLEYLREYVDRARADRLVRPLWQRVHADWADRQTFHLGVSRPYSDPYVHSDKSPLIWFCDDIQCSAAWHEEGADHEHDEITNDDYTLTIWRGRHKKKWLLSVTVDSCGLNSRQAASLANDIQWMQQTCDKLNAPTVTA